jgi:hypothetical protein
MAELSRCAAVAAALESMHGSGETPLGVFEGDDIAFSSSGIEDPSGVGRVNASISVLAHELIVTNPLRKRVQPGGEIRFRISSRVCQEPDSCAAESFKGVARVIRAQIEKIFGGVPTTLDFSVAVSAGGEAPGGCIDLVVTVPADAALGSEVVLRRVSVAGCDVALGKAPVRVIVGFNHEPVPVGRLYASALLGDIPALTQALDDGCSTQETDEASIIICPYSLPEIFRFQGCIYVSCELAWCGSLRRACDYSCGVRSDLLFQ